MTFRTAFVAGLAVSLSLCSLCARQVLTAPPDAAPAIPTLDLSNDTSRQVVIAQGTAEIYQGHPTTVLLPDGKTMFCTWSVGHGGPCGFLKRSDDGGLTWSPLLSVPDNWTTARNCPSLYRLTDPKGVARLFVFAARGPDGTQQQSHSEDDGRTWTPMTSNGLTCIMPFCTVVPVEGGKKLLAQTNVRNPNAKDEKSNLLTQSTSTDGGLTWTPWRVVLDLPNYSPSEPCIVRSPNGKQLLCLIRENARNAGALYMTSDDEGQTWSEAKVTVPGLFGDRHMARYSADGRLVVAFRDVGKLSPTKNHFVVWVGHYADIVNGQEGQYRVKLLHSFKGGDCGYPGLELLPDKTLVATTYIKYREGPEQNSVVSARFKLSETDALAKTQGAKL